MLLDITIKPRNPSQRWIDDFIYHTSHLQDGMLYLGNAVKNFICVLYHPVLHWGAPSNFSSSTQL